MIKKILMCTVFIVGLGLLGGCSESTKNQDDGKGQEESVIASEAGEKMLLPEGEITHIEVAMSFGSFPQYSFSDGESIKTFKEYFTTLDLESDFTEKPEEYNGQTWVVTFTYADQREETIYHFGNMFVRNQNGEWYKMKYEQAARLDEIMDQIGSLKEESEEYAHVSEFIEYFNEPLLSFYKEMNYASVIDFATEKLKKQESSLVRTSDSGEHYVISVDDLTAYIDQYFENAEEVIKSIPTKQNNTGQTLRAGEKVVFYDLPNADYHPMQISGINKDDSHYYVKCVFPEYKHDYASVAELSLAPRVFVISFRDDKLKICGVLMRSIF